MKAAQCALMLVFLGGLLGPGQASAVEPWTDARLPVRSNLVLWLDATHQPTPLILDQPLAIWHDGSGAKRHVSQRQSAAQPRLLRSGEGRALRFDGLDDHLRYLGEPVDLESFTIFLVAVPHYNPGGFRGFLAFNAPNRADYRSGLNLDLSWATSNQLATINIEGNGFGGARNLLNKPQPFGMPHVFEVRGTEEAVQFLLDGTTQGERPRTREPVSFQEITIGARFYSHEPGPQHAQGWIAADLAEVLIYERPLSETEAGQVRRYLEQKHADLKKNRIPVGIGAVDSVPNPPAVQVLAPGFEVRELPLNLPNLNNIKYRQDGKLVALAYDGDVYLLSDTDGDGLEDLAERIYDSGGRLRSPIGMDLTPPGYPHGDGLFVAAKGKCVLLVDTNGDDRIDREIVIAEGWKELPHGVDALGVAYDHRDGSIYFGLGAADFVNAYQTNSEGRGRYSLKSERGTILRVSPDFKQREIVCTGIRFPVAMAFNRQGDLFSTDQEGATWLPNGNPLDELLHIQKGRHYGFPPRHPRHLPNVLDEPSVFDYGPQHQSTCGLNFNEPSVPGGAIFGPESWRGAALVTGYSRGKLYRTQLVKTATGYVAQNHMIACLDQLTVDACVSPAGSLVVATHSGGPDWGSGPLGRGKLYQIRQVDRQQPQPVAIWPASPREVRIAFDRPLTPEQARALTENRRLVQGDPVRAGDRFEVLRPGYAVVQSQLLAPRRELAIHGVQLTADRRTLLLATAPHSHTLHQTLTLGPRGGKRQAEPGAIPQEPGIDLDYDLSGIAARWSGEDGSTWSGWLPHLDLAVARAFTRGSAEHDLLWQRLAKPGTLQLHCRLDLTDLLRPAVQPGSRLDHEFPAEKATLEILATAGLTADFPAEHVQAQTDASGSRIQLSITPRPGQLVPLELTLKKAAGAPDLRVSYHTAEDSRPRALAVRRMLVPWAERPSSKELEPLPLVRHPELEGGNAERGRLVFFSEPANCHRCHKVRGEGGEIGPDLSNLVHRDYASVMRDITEPSHAINPDYVSYVVELKSGRVLTGTVRQTGNRMQIGDQQGNVVRVTRQEVEQMQPTATSIMPEGMPKLLGADRMKDLLVFLLSEPPRMPEYGPLKPPPPRTRAEVQAVLAGAPPAAAVKPLHLVLVAGPKDHGLGEHDYPAWQKVWRELLATSDKVTVTTAWQWPSAEDLQRAQVLVFFQQGQWNAERAKDLDAFLQRGGGVVYIHYAVDGGTDPAGFAKRIGLAWQGGRSKFRHGPLELQFASSQHPVARNFSKLKLYDESYWSLVGDLPAERVLATGVEDKQAQPLFWTTEPGKGRVFVSTPGHYSWTFDDPLFRLLLLRGIAWTAREPVDRFNALIWPGSRVEEK